MNMCGLWCCLQVDTGLYADENISPHSAFRMTADGAKVFIRAILIRFDHDLFSLKCVLFLFRRQPRTSYGFRYFRLERKFAHHMPEPDVVQHIGVYVNEK